MTKNIHENVPISNTFLLKVNLKMFFVFEKRRCKNFKGSQTEIFVLIVPKFGFS